MPRSAVIGTGLIGGSIALALRAPAWDRSPSARERARARGITVAESMEEAVRGAAVVFLALSARETPEVLHAACAIAPEAVFTDVASWKRGVREMAETLPPAVRYVSGHPMAGSTASGVEGSDPALFAGRPWLLVPTSRTDAASLEMVGQCVAEAGAVPVVIEPERHDFAMTWISHLPLIAAAGLARSVCRAVGAEVGSLAGPGLLDTTRLAGTPLPLGTELSLASPEELAEALEILSRELSKVAALLRRGDRAALESFLQDASAARADIANFAAAVK